MTLVGLKKNVDVRGRILLVRCVRVDYKEAASIAENEFHRSRWWAYKWLRYVNLFQLK
jgi:hypothetical protein